MAAANRGSKSWKILLLIAGIHDCLLAAYHFFLPTHMQWNRGLDGVAGSLVWALYALNFSWSLLAFLTGALVIYAALLGPTGTFMRRTIFTVGLFWAIHGAYTWLHPMVMPASLAWLKIVLAAFPLIVVTLHWLPLVLTRAGVRS